MNPVLNFRQIGNRLAASAAGPGPGAVLMPGRAAGEWVLCRPAAAATAEEAARAATRQTFASMEAAALNLEAAEPFILLLPVETGLVQRLPLPAADPAELEEMVRIQLEKILPYPVEAVSMAMQEISRTETDVIVAVETIHHDRLVSLCQPLTARECWPTQVVFHALVLAGSAPADENTAFIYQVSGRFVLAVCEGGSLSFAQALNGQTIEELAAELPATLLGAELEGVPTAFSRVRLDEAMSEWRDTFAAVLGVPVEPFDPVPVALLAAPGREDGDLSPPDWKAERVRGERSVRLRRRLTVGVGIYLGLLLLGALWVGILKVRVARLDAQLAALQPKVEYAKAQDARWRALAPAVQPTKFVVDVLQQMYECRPPGDTIRFTSFEQTPTSLSLQGEAPSPSAAVDYTEKLKSRTELKPYRLDAKPPTPLPNGQAKFFVTGALP